MSRVIATEILIAFKFDIPQRQNKPRSIAAPHPHLTAQNPKPRALEQPGPSNQAISKRELPRMDEKGQLTS
jgi:hypothetical protein